MSAHKVYYIHGQGIILNQQQKGINMDNTAKLAKFQAAIIRVAEITNQTKWEVAEKLKAKDDWTWFLVLEAEKKIK